MRVSQRGFGLATLLVMALLISVFAAAVSVAINQRLVATTHRAKKLRAEYVASAGLEMTLRRLQDDETLFVPSGTWHSDDVPALALSDPDTKFEVEVVNNRSTATVSAPDGTDLAPRQVWMRSTAIIEGERIDNNSGRTTMRAAQPQVHFLHALHVTDHRPSLENITVAPAASAPPGTKASVRLEEGAWFNVANTIDGDLVYPSEDEFASPWSQFTATGIQRAEEKFYPKLQFRPPSHLESTVALSAPSGGTISPGRYGNSTFTSNITLQPGDYFFYRFHLQPNLELNLAPTVTPSNPTRIYIDNDYVIGENSEVNEGGDPRSLGIFGIDTGDVWWDHEIDLGNNSKNTCVIAASQKWTMPVHPVRTGVTLNGALIIGFMWDMTQFTINYEPLLLNNTIEARTEWVLLNDGEG